MSDETKVADQQAFAGVHLSDQPQRTEHCTRRADGQRKLEPGVLPERG
jgi:hypothetical protein